MAWVTPPTFSDGAILSAAQLNILSEDIAWLYERAQQVNVARQPLSISVGDGDEEEVSAAIRHKFNTLEYRIAMSGGTFDDLSIQYDSTTIFTDTNDRSNPYVYSGTIDLTSFGFTVGQVYRVRISAGGEPGSPNNAADIDVLQEIP